MQSAWFNDDTTHTAFKLQLFPLELGHLFILRNLQSPYLLDSEIRVATRFDALMFAFVACSTFERANKRMLSPLLGFWLWCFKLVSRKCSFQEENQRIQNFLSSQYQVLQMAYKKESANQWVSETPYEYSLLCSAMTELNMTMTEAMRTPIKMLSNLLAVRSTQTGPSAILNDRQIHVLNLAKSKRKEVERN